MTIRGLTWSLLFQVLFIAKVVSTQCLDDQRSLLLQLKHNLVFDSDYSTKLVNWNQSADCCIWDGVACDTSGHVISLDLAFENITGGIANSTALFGLQYLQELNLAFNYFDGLHIPKGLGNFTNLSYLNLSYSGFAGQIPIEVSTLRSLVILDLSTFYLGDKPLKLENPTLQMLVQNLTMLKELYLDSVDASAQKGDWSRSLSSSLPDLRTLSLRSCRLSGPLDSSLLGLHSLSVLRLDGNNLSTMDLEFFTNISSLTTLSLGDCLLQGTFPPTIFQVPTLQTLDLSYNSLLSGTIPQFPFNSSFRTMVLSSTNFSGLLPDSIGNLRMLSHIDLSFCNFTGTIPSSITNLTELVYMDFSRNSFTGSIPSFSMSHKLAYLDLSHNSLTGLLSSNHFEGLSNLVSINFGTNKLKGTIPPSLFDLPSLQTLQLNNNKFSGQINEFSISNPSTMEFIDLRNNQLEGYLPESFLKLEGLIIASLSFNLFNGTLKLEMFQRFINLSTLELGYNKFFVDTSNSSSLGSSELSLLDLASCNLYNFPDLRNLSRLVYLDLSNNHIAGEIPSWIWTIGGGVLHLNLSSNVLVSLQKPVNMHRYLSVVDLHSNKIQDELPLPPEGVLYVDYSSNNFQQPIPINILNSNSSIKFFSLANNSLHGTIPASLCNAISVLEVLDLSDNHLSGSIPPCLLGNVKTNLAVFNIRRNNISGNIPHGFSVNCNLRTLDVSNNRLGGTIPASMANCKSLELVNVGNNNIDDTFPCWLKSVSSLHVLVLRNNNFHGDLGCFGVNESWPNLQIIDIASNNFHGELDSRYFASWKTMMLDNNSPIKDGHLGFQFFNLNNLYYQDAVTITFKGLELELVKILTIFTAIDFSDNKFSGEIPQTVGELTSLYVLNLSHNAFTGMIPTSIGKLKQLGSLDLSMNHLAGKIPQELTQITFLSVLNLSYNKLSGRIPTGPQFQTFSASSFAGNSELCGFPLEANCDPDWTAHGGDSNDIEYDWQLIITGAGYGVGLVLVVVPVALCKQWRKYFTKQLDKFLMLIFPGFMLANLSGRRTRRRR